MTRNSRQLFILFVAVLVLAATASAQQFDFERLNKVAREFAVIINMDVELSFGIQTSEHQQRLLGTIVSTDGIVLFDGSLLANGDVFAASGFSVKTTPTKIEVELQDGKKYPAEFIGTDRFTRLGFMQIISDEEFKPVRFSKSDKLEVGDWVALYMLLPEYVDPPMAADIGMVSTIITSPEYFPLTVGFGPFQSAAVLFDESSNPIGVLGSLLDPTTAASDAGGMLESFGEPEFPMLGVISAERLEKLVADPPRKGDVDRAWLGISLQALTKDIGEYLGISIPGGIIVNDVMAGSPASDAGLEVGDVIYQVNGQAVEVDREDKVAIFQRLISEMGPGTAVEFSVYRPVDNRLDSLTLLANLVAAPLGASEAAEYESESLEFKVRDMVFADYMFFNLDQQEFKGVVVSELKQGGLAMIGGLSLGDIIQQIGDTQITSVEDAETVLLRLEKDRPAEIVFFVWRDNRTLFVNVKTDWQAQ